MNAFHSLARNVEDEAISFEGRVYGEPFLPRNELESRSLFQWLCRDIDCSLSQDHQLRHYSWMSRGREARECYYFSCHGQQVDYRVQTFAPPRNSKSLYAPNLFDEVVLPALTNRTVKKHWSDHDTPREIPAGALILLNAYLIFRDPIVEEFINSRWGAQKQGFTDYEFVRFCREDHPNWKDRFIYCKTFVIDAESSDACLVNALEVQHHLATYVHNRHLHFQAYHLMVMDPKPASADIYEKYKMEFVRLRIMQFQSDWKIKEKNHGELQKTGWAYGKAWAHEVKNYTGLISATLLPLQRTDLSDPEEVLSRVKRATQGLLILNAVSYAVQLAFAKKSGVTRASDKSFLEKLPRDKARAIVEAILQYLLNFYAEAKHSEFNLRWDNRISADIAIQTLRALVEITELSRISRDHEILTKSDFIWVLALLREVIGNIRLVNPVDDDKLVWVSYQFSMTEHELILSIVQEQTEWAFETEKVEDPAGIRMTNELFGKHDGAGFGEITVRRPLLEELEDGACRIRLEVEVRFAVT